MGQPLGEVEERVVVRRGFGTAHADHRRRPPAVLHRQQHAAGGVPGDVGDHDDARGTAVPLGRRAEQPGGVGGARVDHLVGDRRQSDPRQPGLDVRRAAGGRHHEARPDRRGPARTALAHPGARHPLRVAEQALHLGVRQQAHPRVPQDLAAYHPVEQVAPAGHHELLVPHPGQPAELGQEGHVAGSAQQLGTRLGPGRQGAGQQLFDRTGTGAHQQVRLAGLGQPLAGFGTVGRDVALHDGHGVHVLGQHLCRQHAGEPAAEDEAVLTDCV